MSYEERIDALYDELAEVRLENEELRGENEHLDSENSRLEDEVYDLRKALEEIYDIVRGYQG